jgi:hypothetical protein
MCGMICVAASCPANADIITSSDIAALHLQITQTAAFQQLRQHDFGIGSGADGAHYFGAALRKSHKNCSLGMSAQVQFPGIKLTLTPLGAELNASINIFEFIVSK